MTTLDFGFDLEIKDLGFLDEMVAGGISDDLSPRSGDVSADDHTDYMSLTVNNTSEEIEEILAYLDSL